jgi:hypothetical protein
LGREQVTPQTWNNISLIFKNCLKRTWIFALIIYLAIFEVLYLLRYKSA